jgi:hypothetical protein
MSNITVSHLSRFDYSQLSNPSGLLSLLAYALQPQHQHSRQWVGAISLLLQRGGVAHG